MERMETPQRDSNQDEDEEEEDWDDWGEEDNKVNGTCVFCSVPFDSLDLLRDHLSSSHGFYLDSLSLDVYECIHIVNWLRENVRLRGFTLPVALT